MDDRPHHPDQAMENPAPFDLNQAIHRWRERISGSPAVCHKDMDELEDHLRDATASLERRGLTAQEAFWIAQHRLGQGDVLQAEFGKVNRSQVWLDRALWMVLGSLAFSGLFSMSSAMGNLADLSLNLMVGGRGFLPVSLLFNPASFGLLLLLLWRWANHSGAPFTRHGRWIWANPVGAAISATVFLALLHAMQIGVTMLTVRSLSLEQNAASMMWSFSRAVLFSLITPALLGWLLHRILRQRETASLR